MKRTDPRIDGGVGFDWGRVSEDYAKYRDIYPELFYRKIVENGLCVKGQKVLDLGTGTGVLPRNLYRYGADWTGIDVSPEQIAQARRLSEAGSMAIKYQTLAAEQITFPAQSFDVITACQCFWYFDLDALLPRLCRVLKDGGRLLLLYLAWLPYEDALAGKSEALVLKYHPAWSGAGGTRRPIPLPKLLLERFDLEKQEDYELSIPFTRERWHGRMRACRGVGASLSEERLAAWEAEHWAMLCENAPEAFSVKHYAAYAILKKKREERV